MRAAGSDDAVRVPPAVKYSLEEALEFVNDDELVEVVPDDIRLRKKYLNELERRRKRNRGEL
jgi:GTP-binding protein